MLPRPYSYMVLHIHLQVYELSAEVALKALNHAEAIKVLRQLVEHLYPACIQALMAGGGWRHDNESSSAVMKAVGGAVSPLPLLAWQEQDKDLLELGNWVDGECSALRCLAGLDADALHAALKAHPECGRYPEAAAALVLFIGSSWGAGAGMDLTMLLRRLPSGLQRGPQVQGALRALGLLRLGNAPGYWTCAAGAKPLVRLAMRFYSGQAQQRSLTALACAYQSIDIPELMRMLGFGSGGELMQCLKATGPR
jgi:hypothetical protein